ncbi:MAG TPA: VWA domain-containing protein [Candidatus Acidoferrum sp.]
MVNRSYCGLAVRVASAIFVMLLLSAAALGQAPPPATNQPSAKTDGGANAPQSPGNSAGAGEFSTHDALTSLKVRVNLVLVRVVARDSKGTVITNLEKKDFRLFDNRKEQVISSFSVEKREPDIPRVTTVSSAASVSSATAVGSEPGTIRPATAPAMPQRFVALVFDDTNLKFGDVAFVREQSTRLFGALAATDRVGVFSTSGQLTQDFTDNRELLKKAIMGISPRPLSGGFQGRECPEMSYYEADQIVNVGNTQALIVATDDALHCAFGGDRKLVGNAQQYAEDAASRELALGEAQTQNVFRHLEDVMRRLAVMPGQRILALVSPGFMLTVKTQGREDLVDRANRSNIVINTIDGRGLYTPDLGDLGDPSSRSPQTAGIKLSYQLAAQSAQNDILAVLADGTGGTFFHNRNDVDEGMREAVGAPAMSYLLAFSPENLKLDGRYHTLRVTLTGKQKVMLQARHGYYAPKTIKDPVQAAKEEIEDALFSQADSGNLPIDLQTQFSKLGDSGTRLAVLTHVDVKGMRFRKSEGRNLNSLTVAIAIFDGNGKFVTGGEKEVDLRFLDSTLEHLAGNGFFIKSTFDLKPGNYLVRMLVRDAEESQTVVRSGTVTVPS